MKLLEKDIEKALVNRVKVLGGMAKKFKSPGRRCYPDCLISLPGGKLTEAQLRDHEKRRALGYDVRVIDSLEQVNLFPEEE